MNHASKATAHEIKIRRVAYFYSAAERRSRGALWPSFAPALILHDKLDGVVLDAYGWPHDLTIEQILERVVALNAERRVEEASGLIRWLRPEYQAPNYVPTTATLEGFIEEAPAARRKQSWPTAIPDQFRVVKDAMRSASPQTPQQIASNFRPAPRTRVAEILATLTALGQARESAGRYSL